jgi:hypothetical protein
MSNHRNTSQQLREMLIFSGSDHFMRNGHQIINSNRAFAGPRRKNAEWALDDGFVQALLLKAFPKLRTDEKQRERAGRWVRVINLYFKSGMSFGQAAEEMGLPKRKVEGVIRSVHRAVSGRRADGKGFKKHAVTGTDLGDQSEPTGRGKGTHLPQHKHQDPDAAVLGTNPLVLHGRS